jgi:thiol-disulfide isomerase/thioredoxin
MSSSLPTRAAVAALIGLAVALPSVLAAPTKPAPAAKAGTPAAVGASLSAIEEACDKAEKDGSTALRRKRYEAVAAYVKASTTAKDIADARNTAVNLAEELEDWAGVVEHADDYLKNHATGETHVDIQLSRAGALGHLAKLDDAKKAYDEALKGLDLEKNGANTMWGAYVGYATMLADANDIEGAKKQYQAAKDAMSGIPQVNALAEAAIKGLDEIGKDATAFPEDAKDLDGKVVTLGDFKGKVLLIDFWATWCGPCRAEMPNVIKAYEKYHAKGFEIVGITLDRPGDTDKVKKFITDKKMPWRQVYYPADHNKVAEAYEVSGIPHTVLVGKDGKVIRAGLRGESLLKTLEGLFGAK